MSSDAELQARIVELAGRLNRRKNEESQPIAGPPYRQYNPRLNPRWNPYQPVKYANKVLVNNHASSTPSFTTTPPEPAQPNRPRSTDPSIHDAKRQRVERAEPTKRIINIAGLDFEVKEDGSKLIRQGDLTNIKATPRQVEISGVDFLRSKNGNLIRQAKSKSIGQPARPQCENFTKNGNHRYRHSGTCSYGPKCHFSHDPLKVAICKTFLRNGTCPNGQHCDLSHKMTYHRVPACHHFQRSACTNKDCRYPHVHSPAGAPVCRTFAFLGYCEHGTKCEKRHVFECPDYANTGVCTIKKCPLPHVLHAAHERATAQSSEVDSEVDEVQDVTLDAGSEDLYETLSSTGKAAAAAKQLSNNEDFISLD